MRWANDRPIALWENQRQPRKQQAAGAHLSSVGFSVPSLSAKFFFDIGWFSTCRNSADVAALAFQREVIGCALRGTIPIGPLLSPEGLGPER